MEIFSNREVIADEKVIENQWKNIFKKEKGDYIKINEFK